MKTKEIKFIMNYVEHLFVNFSFENKNENFVSFYFALIKEISAFKAKYQFKIKTIYVATTDFLLLGNQQLTLLLELLKEFVSADLVEYNFEIGYQTIGQEQLAILNTFKINRLVWRIRTFNSKLLKNLNQKFNAQDMMILIKSSFAFFNQNFSIDLENNIDDQTSKDIISDLKIALKLKAPHISYQSSSESHDHVNKEVIISFLEQHDYQNYEFFSFGLKKENYGQQTLAYLTLKNWFGFGPNATSFFKLNDTVTTISNNNNIPWTSEIMILDQEEYFQLLIIQNLTLKQGLILEKENLLAIKSVWSDIFNLINKKYLLIENNYLKVTNDGWLLLNDVFLDIIK